MVGSGGQPAWRRPAALQRVAALDRRHLATHADPDAARARARRSGDAHGVSTIPPRVDYALTALGRDLLQPVSALGAWALRNQSKIAQARAQFDGNCEAKGKPPLRRHGARTGLVLAAHKT